METQQDSSTQSNSNVRYLSNTNSYEEVINVPLPKRTRTYVPVPNIDIIDNLKKICNYYDFEVIDEKYNLARKDQQMFGAFTIQDNDSEIQKAIGFRNSYDKSMPVGFVAGAEVIVCSNLMFDGEIMMVKKHTTNVFEHLENLMVDIVRSLQNTFDKIKRDKENLKLVTVDKNLVGDIVREMFIERELLSVNQLSIFKKEYLEKENRLSKEQRNLFPQTGWNIMNHITESLKKEHASTRMNKQVEVHEYLTKKLLSV